MTYRHYGSLQVAEPLAALVETEIAPGSGIDPARFWAEYEKVVADLVPTNRQLLEKRDKLQVQIDDWHERHRGEPIDMEAYRHFLTNIGYIVPVGSDFAVAPQNVDDEIAKLAGPQLVVPVSNARFALNAANARWGSLYDALYGTDVIPSDGELAPSKGYNAKRGAAVINRAAAYLDAMIPLAGASHADVEGYTLGASGFEASVDGRVLHLADPAQYRGRSQNTGRTTYLFVHNHLHLELVIDSLDPVGRATRSGLCDVVLEAALTTIQDCEDSVAAVDAEDKVDVYRNWLGLMKGDLTATLNKGGKTIERRLAEDREYEAANGERLVLPGRSLMLVRHVGHLMTTDAVLDAEGRETPEGIMDAMVATFAALHDLQKTIGARNSRTGSIYVVKPKMHGPEEVGFANMLFDRVEDALGLARNTIKIGVMDEERRTTVNLKEAIRAVRDRIVFINTGFLDRTGDEIHTSMHAGPVVPKDMIKSATWLGAYEANNVDIGLGAHFGGKAQIGKGMWAKPDAMAEMLATKAGQMRAGASTAWVPSPTAAVLHALHYHEVDVRAQQAEIRDRDPAKLEAILTPPLLHGQNLSEADVQREVDNNCQSILGYVVRWIDQGIGCSKVPDINDVALMEDRATLRISSQHLANWIFHGVVHRQKVEDSLARMAEAVDRQNANDPAYEPMGPDLKGNIAFETASALIFEGLGQPNGYTEPLLHEGRRRKKQQAAAA
ncbi:malate synthase G [Devosia sp. BK]|uniref:malate synthase G n=1 Tax=Devosia sp. BK TaxID=2871706 RepID=UPI00293B71FB|nr:malate synthase G [Devosia sp. BK]MDV3249733.1 malate synthase G [Devosia sp. BK]